MGIPVITNLIKPFLGMQKLSHLASVWNNWWSRPLSSIPRIVVIITGEYYIAYYALSISYWENT